MIGGINDFPSVSDKYIVTKNTETDYITLTPKNAQHTYSLIWLHGLGDTAHGFSYWTFAILADMDEDISLVPPTCKIIIPTAPVREMTCNGRQRMTSWYDVKTF